MNTNLALLYFILILSRAFSKDCSESDCNFDNIEEVKKAYYACVSGTNEDCVLQLKSCSVVEKSDEDTTFKCSDFPVGNNYKTCIDKDMTTCKEEYLCSFVPKPSGEETVTCDSFPVSDKTKFACEADGT